YATNMRPLYLQHGSHRSMKGGVCAGFGDALSSIDCAGVGGCRLTALSVFCFGAMIWLVF
ncbi:MAG: hypothetical protein ACPHN3_09625, partial [Spongiibacter sp.]